MQEAGFIPQRFSSADIIPPFEEPLTFSSPSDNNPSASNNDNTDNMENQPHPNIQANINSNQGRTSPQLPRGIILGTGGPRRNVGADPPIPYAHLQSQIRGRNVGVDPPIPYLIQGQFRGRGRQFSFRSQGTPPQAARSRGNRGRIPSNPGAPRIVVTAPGAPAIHQDPHHPVFPPHEKIEVKIAEWEEFHEHPGFKLTFSFRRDIGMRQPGADCGCQVGGAHYCCGGLCPIRRL
jgi:hypothetical protein